MANDNAAAKEKIAWLDGFAKRATAELMNMIDDDAKGESLNFRREMAVHVIARIVASVVYGVLKERPQGVGVTQEQVEAYVSFNFAKVKDRMQDAVAIAFQNAMSHFVGKRIDYYCQIRPMPDPQNKLPC